MEVDAAAAIFRLFSFTSGARGFLRNLQLPRELSMRAEVGEGVKCDGSGWGERRSARVVIQYFSTFDRVFGHRLRIRVGVYGSRITFHAATFPNFSEFFLLVIAFLGFPISLPAISSTHLAVIARPYHAVSVPMVRVSLHLRVHSVVIVRLLLRLLHLRLMTVGVEGGAIACDDADLLIVLVCTSRAMFSCALQSVEGLIGVIYDCGLMSRRLTMDTEVRRAYSSSCCSSHEKTDCSRP